jgi:hypothetical protein
VSSDQVAHCLEDLRPDVPEQMIVLKALTEIHLNTKDTRARRKEERGLSRIEWRIAANPHDHSVFDAAKAELLVWAGHLGKYRRLLNSSAGFAPSMKAMRMRW